MTGYQIYCNASACVKGAIDSTVESMSSKLEHHNIEGQRITADHLSEEVFLRGMILKFNTVIMSYEEHSRDILVARTCTSSTV